MKRKADKRVENDYLTVYLTLFLTELLTLFLVLLKGATERHWKLPVRQISGYRIFWRSIIRNYFINTIYLP